MLKRWERIIVILFFFCSIILMSVYGFSNKVANYIMAAMLICVAIGTAVDIYHFKMYMNDHKKYEEEALQVRMEQTKSETK